MDGSTELPICDNEPIHTPGAIQAHGVMLVGSRDTQLVLQAAGEVEAWLGTADWRGAPLASLIGPEISERIARLAAATPADGAPHVGYIGRLLQQDGSRMDVSAHVAGVAGAAADQRPYVIVELEPAPPEAPSSLLLDQLEAAGAEFQRATTLDQLYAAAARHFRRLIGYDRVLIYRFGEDEAGSVCAEDRDPALPSFMNHRFPASDIPRQARALYVRNLVRVIPDINYTPARLQPAAPGAPLDLSDSSLRSVSPIHLQYMFNMGMSASASFSLVREGALWGLVACHHRAPLGISYDLRVACRSLAAALAREIRGKEEAEGYRQRLRLRGFEDDLVRLLSREAALDRALSRHVGEVQRTMDADGVAVLRDAELFTGGVCPPAEAIRQLAAWIAENAAAEPVRATDRLSELYPPGAAFAGQGSGVLSMVLSVDGPWIVLWFRAEQIERVRWAGDPRKSPLGDWAGMLTPRSSFEAWEETVRGRSRRWTLPEIEAAGRLRGALLQARQNRHLAELNRRLTQLLQDKTLLLQQKEFLIGEVDHRIQNSLQLVASFLTMQARVSDSEEVRVALEEARKRLGAVALVHQRLYRGGQVEMIDTARYVEDLCADTLTAMGADWRAHLTLELAPVSLSPERAIPLGLVLTELMINVNKYAYGGVPGPLDIRLVQDRTRLTLTVADRGGGRQGEHEGFGSRMMKALVQQLGGRLDYEDNRPGLRAVLTAEIDG